MRSYRFFPAFLIVFFLAFAAQASAGEVKLGYVNLQKALNDSVAGKKAKEYLQKEAEALEDELDTRQETLKGLKEEIDKKGTVWNKETLEKKQQEFKKLSEEFNEKYRAYGDELNRKKKDTEEQIIEELREIVENIAKKEGYTFVFESAMGALVYAPDEADLTKAVIRAYNKQVRKEERE